MILILIAINIYLSWRYSRIDIEPDFAMYLLWGQTGAKYGKDFIDCKMPLVHLLLKGISVITKKNIVLTRAVFFFLTGLPSIVAYLITGNMAMSLAFLVLVHAGWLYSFHGNVGDIPAGLIFLALLIPNPWIFVTLLVIVTLYEPKLIVATAPMLLLRITSLWLPLTIAVALCLLAIAAIWYFKHDLFDWLVEGNWKITRRMQKYRKGAYSFMPFFTGTTFLYILPWLALAIWAKPDILYWLPALLFLALTFTGRVVRPNHLLPLVAWIAAAGIPLGYVIAMSSMDFISSGFYLGNIWGRFYQGLRDVIKDSHAIGNWLKDKEGTLWVNTLHTEIYLWSGKKPQYGMTEQIELDQLSWERRPAMLKNQRAHPSDWIVSQIGHGMEFNYKDYYVSAKSAYFTVWKRKEK
jgi:hypothetical protein